MMKPVTGLGNKQVISVAFLQTTLRRAFQPLEENLNREARKYKRPGEVKRPGTVLMELELLAKYLNRGKGKPRQKLVSDLEWLIDWRKLPVANVKSSAKGLAEELSRLKTKWSVVYPGWGCPLLSPNSRSTSRRGKWYEVLARAIQREEISWLKKCLMCRSFFVSPDHRKHFCNKNCFKASEAVRVNQYRKRLKAKGVEAGRNSEDQQFVEFVETFLRYAGGPIKDRQKINLIVTAIPGKWRSVNKWLNQRRRKVSIGEIVNNLSKKERESFYIG